VLKNIIKSNKKTQTQKTLTTFALLNSRKANFIKGPPPNPSAASGLGFTLIELLVVVSVIGFLSTSIFAMFDSARIKARDAIRISDMKTIQTALDLYYAANDKYPALHAYTSDEDVAGDNCGTNWCNLEANLLPYLPVLPRDPTKSKGNVFRYYYDSDTDDSNQSYGLMSRLQSSNNFALAINDGGFYNTVNGRYYEVGLQPKYCGGKCDVPPGPPILANANWWGGGANVCIGGN